MLIGSTYAWFTDTASTGINKIQAGNLDVEVTHTNALITSEENIQDKTDLFKSNNPENPSMLWEPGAVSWETFTVKNVGNLAFKFNMGLGIKSYSDVNGKSLLDVLKVAIVDDIPTDRGSAISLFENSANVKDINEAIRDNAVTGLLFGTMDENHISAGGLSQKEFTMIIYWEPTSNDNDYNMNNSLQGNVLDIEFIIQLNATQYTEENDSFNEQYDKDAEFALDPVSTVKRESAVAQVTVNPNGSASYVSTASPTTRSASDYVTTVSFTKPDSEYSNLQLSVDTTNTLFRIEKNASAQVASLNIVATKNGTQIHEFNDDEIALVETFISTGLEYVTVVYPNTSETWGNGTDSYSSKETLNYNDHNLFYDPFTGELAFVTNHFSEFSAFGSGGVAYTQNNDTDCIYNTYEIAANATVGENAVEVKLPINISSEEMKEAQNVAADVDGSAFVLTENQVNKNDDLSERYFEARIGNKYYATLDSAIEGGNSNNIICLIKNLEKGKIKFEDKNITIDLNGFTLSSNAIDAFEITSSTLTLKDSSENETGIIIHTGLDDIVYAKSSSKVNIISGKYITSGSYGVLYSGISGIIGGKFNTDKVKCANGYEPVLEGEWYVPKKVEYWTDYTEDFTNKDVATKTLEIATAGQLAMFAKEVNSGNSYSGWKVSLVNDIDLAGKRWTPIGMVGAKFAGTFDADNHTISNVKVKMSGSWSVGFFSKCNSSAKIQNVIFNNVDVIGGHATAAVLGGSGGSEAKLDNIIVKGDISVKGGWYTGTIFGYGYTTIKNCHVEANNGSYVGGGYGNGYAGGIVGFLGEGNNSILDCSVNNLFIESSYNGVGGISGILHYGNTIVNCHVTNTVVHQCTADAEEIGRVALIAGTYLTHENQTETLTNCSFSNGDVYDDVANYSNTGRWIGGPWNGYQEEVGELIVSGNIEN